MSEQALQMKISGQNSDYLQMVSGHTLPPLSSELMLPKRMSIRPYTRSRAEEIGDSMQHVELRVLLGHLRPTASRVLAVYGVAVVLPF